MDERISCRLPILYSFRRCPYAMRARLAIASSGQRCELREVVLRDKPLALIDASPKATVPVLVLADGQVLEQSLDIMLWALRQRDPDGWLTPQTESLDAMLALIAECDEIFKPALDRYKYPRRYAAEHVDPPTGIEIGYRAAGARWLQTLEGRLTERAYLFGDRVALADMAIAPFVRQYAHVDRDWFGAEPWPKLREWLDAWLETELFSSVMTKYQAWADGSAAVYFGRAYNPG